MKRQIIITEDGSSSIFLPEMKEQYHSRHGAIQEAEHVFIKMGLLCFTERFLKQQISILEMGFGTGLNALVTYKAALQNNLRIDYTGVEAFPVTAEETAQLNYPDVLELENGKSFFEKIHLAKWEEKVVVNDFFQLKKMKLRFEEVDEKAQYDLIFFDAFGAQVQPELWGPVIFEKMYTALKSPGILVTYAAKGSVRRAMQEVGFKVERVAGPPGKREMLRATKI